MSVQLQIEEMPGYLAARFIGTGAVEEIRRQFEMIAEHCKRANKNKLLLDFREAYVKTSLTDRFFLVVGSQICAQHKVIQIAAVFRPGRIDPKGFDETVARNRWINARVFSNVEGALEWLLK